MKKEKTEKYFFRRYIIKNGIRIYSKNGKVFKIPVEDWSVFRKCWTVIFRLLIGGDDLWEIINLL